MFCKNCGNELENNAKFCSKCGCSVEEGNPHQYNTNNVNSFGTIKSGNLFSKSTTNCNPNQTPKCTHCGYVGNWTIGPILRPIDFVIGIVFLFLGIFPGLIYLGVVAAIRMNPDRREKICPNCKAQNLWTFIDDRK